MEIDKIIGCLERAKYSLCSNCYHPMSVGWCDKCGIDKGIDEAIEIIKKYNAEKEEAYRNALALGLECEEVGEK